MEKKLNLREKVEEINERFALKTKKNINIDPLEIKITQIKKKITLLAQKNNQEMQEIKQSADLMLQKSEQTSLSFQNEANLQLQQLQELGKQLTFHIQSQICQRKQKQNQLIDVIQKKTRLLKQQIQKEQELRNSILDQISSTLLKDVPSLMKFIIDATQQRQENEEKVAELIQTQLTTCKEKNSEIKQLIQQNEKKAFELIRDLTLKAKKQIEEQRKIREETHDQILTYVEQTCNKLSEISH